jgi:zeta-carotene isomerase
VGEDSAVFRLGDQRVLSWAYFSGILAVVLYALNVLWIDPATGFGTSFLDAVGSISDSHEVRPSSLPMLNSPFIHPFRSAACC